MSERLTMPQAIVVRAIFEENEAWEECKQVEPNVVKALDILPDTSGIADCNVVWQDIFEDVIKKAKKAEVFS